MIARIHKDRRTTVVCAASGAVALVVFAADLVAPLGVAGGVPYVALVLLGAWWPDRRAPLGLAAVATVLILLGGALSPPAPDDLPAWVVGVNRALALAAVWATAAALVWWRRIWGRVSDATAELSRARERLEAEVRDHKAAAATLAEREARLSGIVDHAGEAIITIDESGAIRSFNRGAESIFGYGADEALGESVKMLMPEPCRSEHDGYLRRYLSTGKPRVLGRGPQDLTGRRKCGATFPAEISINEMWLGDRRLFVGTARDVTRRKNAEMQLFHSQKMEAMGQLTGGIAHDFNNLLTVIMGNTQLLAERLPEESAGRRAAETAAAAAARAAELTDRLLAYSRRQPLRPEPVNVNALVRDMTELLRRTLGESIEIETVLGGGLWHAHVDPGPLESAVLNLVINARDAMPDGGKLTIETANMRLDEAYAEQHREVSPGQYVMLAVSDTGTGMSPEVAEHAFEPFFSTKEVGRGSGLGLSTIYGFVKQSGGHIKIYSEEGQGTTVRLYLPRAPAQTVRERAAPYDEAGVPAGTETILVVEDDPDVREFVVTTLGALGYRIVMAPDGPSALAILEHGGDIDLLFTDVVLPGGLNGRELADAARRKYPRLKVLFTSGYTENAVIHQGRLDEGIELLVKPYRREALARKLRRVLESDIG